ncbi:hypothetical protein EV195_10843 [Tenacibaculum skagerrakense]|uniref:Uncharacterized protein n=1 Tax=Tenacibaculum skagerrakense TaxID=186571 RepID=A0A4R2NQA9_9FLAO|nr:hypothetical protein EV195_10843 [Tenacibaculum skagerrakense]
MKNLKNLNGFKVLSKKEQSEINGAISRPYCKGNNMCCIRINATFEFCDYGYCQGFGQCIWA